MDKERREQIDKAFTDYVRQSPSCNNYEYLAFIAGAEWADNTMIERAVDFLVHNMASGEYIGVNDIIMKAEFIQRFKRQMKGE